MVHKTGVELHRYSRLYTVVWSSIFVIAAIVITVAAVFMLAPHKVSVKMNAAGLADGERQVVVRAVSTTTSADILSMTANASVKDGVLTTDFVPPKELEGKSYVVEICTTKSGDSTESCLTRSSSPESPDTTVSSAQDKPLFSCPYYVAEQKSSPIANLTGQNTVEADNKVACDTPVVGAPKNSDIGLKEESAIESLQTMQTQGVAIEGNGVLVAKDGSLSAVDASSLFTQEITNQYFAVAPSSPSPSLTLQGSVLSLGDSSVTLPEDRDTQYPVASSTSGGILSAADWNTFAGKQNALMFDSSFVQSGNAISLMNCTSGQILKNNGTAWVCAADAGSSLGSYTAGTGISINGANVITNSGMWGLTASGAISSSGGQTPAISLNTSTDFTQLASQLNLANSGVVSGTYNTVTVDAKGRTVSGTNVSYLTAEGDAVVGNEVRDVVSGSGLVLSGGGTSVDPYKVGLITSCSSGQLLKWSGSAWICASDVDTNTDAQSLSYNSATNVLSLANGGSIDLSELQDNSDSQTLSYSAGTRTISLSNGGSVVLPTDQDTTYSAGNGINLVGSVFGISAPTCVSSDKLQWNGSAFVCSTDIDTNTDLQTISWDNGNRALTISGSGASVVIPDTDTNSGGTVTGITAGAGLSGGTISTSGTLSLSNSGAIAGSYGGGTMVPVITVDQYGRITSASESAIPVSNSMTSGLLSSSDWTAFNGKENVLSFSDGLLRTGNSVTLMDCAANQVLQRNTGDTAWLCANQVVDSNTTYSAGTGISLVGTTFSSTGALTVSASGALTSTGGQNPAVTLATTADFEQLGNQLGLSDTGVSGGTYNGISVDQKGRVTGATQMNYLTAESDSVVGNEVAGVVNNGGLMLAGSGTDLDPYSVGLITSCNDGQILKYTSAGGWACASDLDVDTNTDAQTVAWNTGTNTLSVSGGNSVDLSSLLDNTDSQSITRIGNTLSISGNGSTVDLSAYLDNTDNQTLSWNDGLRSLSLANGGTVVISDSDTTYSNGNGMALSGTVFSISAPTCTGVTAKLLWSGTSFTCGTDVDTNTTYLAGSGLSLVGATFGLAQNGASNGQVLAWNTANEAWEPTSPMTDTDTDEQDLSYDATTRQLSITDGTSITFPLSGSGEASPGLLSQADWNTFDSKENVLSFSDGLLRSGNSVTLMDCAASQIVQRNAGDTAWLCANQVVDTNTTYTAGTGISLVGTTFSNTGVLGVGASGALTSSGGQNPGITLATSGDFTQFTSQLNLSDTGAVAGTYNNVTVDAKGRVTSGTNVSYLTNEVDGVVGNEVAGVAINGGLVLSGAGSSVDPYRVGLVTSCSAGQLLKYYPVDPDGAGPLVAGWNCTTDTDTNTDTQTLSWNTGTNMLSITGGNTVDLTSLKDNTDSQAISLGGNTLSITGNAGTVDLSGYLDNTDSQALSWNSGTRTLGLANGGSVVISDADTTYTAGTGITLSGTTVSLTNDFGTSIDSTEITDGTITSGDLATTGATAGTYGNSGVSVAQVMVNAQGQVTGISNRALPTASSGTTGVLSSADWSTFNGKENVLAFSDGLARTGNTASLVDCAASQILQRNAGDTAWLCANQVTDTNTTYGAGSGISLVGTTFSNTGVLSVGASGALTSSGDQNPGLTLATSSDFTQLTSQLNLSDTGVAAGTYNSVTVDAKGRITNGTTISYLTSETDAVIGNEVAGVAANGGLVLSGAGTSGSPYQVGLVTSCSAGQVLKYYPTDPDGAGPLVAGWNCSNDTDTNTDAQTLSWNSGTNMLSVAGGNTVDLTSLKDNTDGQAISLAGNTLSITGNAGTVDLSGYLDNTDSQALSWNGGTRTLSLSNGGSVVISDNDTTYSNGNGLSLASGVFSINSPTCSGTTKLQWTGSAFTCSADIDTNTTYSNGTGLSLVGTVFSLSSTSVAANTYAPANNANGSMAVPQFTVNAQGQLTAASTANVTLTGIANSQLANNSLTISAGNGLINGGSVALGGTATVNIGAGNGITVNADDIAVRVTVSADGLSTTTSSGSGLEVLASGVTLLQGCSDGQVLKWTEGTDLWNCAADDGAALVIGALNGQTKSANGAVVSAGALYLQSADATNPGLVTTVAQTFAGDKTFNGLTFLNASGATIGDGLRIDTPNLTTGNALSITGPTETGGTGGNDMLRVRNDATQGYNQPQVVIGSGDTNNPDALARDQLYVFGRINSSWQQQWTECLAGQSSLTASTAGAVAQGAMFTGSSAAGTLTLPTSSGVSGMCRITTTAVASQALTLGSNSLFATERSLNPIMESRVNAGASTAQRALIGFTNRSQSALMSTDATTTTTATTNFGTYGAYFRKNAADTSWSAVTTNNGTATTTTGVATTNGWHRFRVEIDNVKSEVRFYVDATLVATHTTNLPPSTQQLGYGITNSTSAGTAGITLDIDYMRVWSDDPPLSTQLSATVVEALTSGENEAIETGTVVEAIESQQDDEVTQLEALLPGVVVKDTAEIDQMKLATELLRKLTALDERIAALEARSMDIVSATWSGGIVAEDTTFNGLVTFNNNVIFTSNNAGSVVIPAGTTTASILFKSTQPGLPRVVATPQDFVESPWKVTGSSAAGFTIELREAQESDISFDWHAFSGG